MFALPPVTRLGLGQWENININIPLINILNININEYYRTGSVTHPDITLNVEGGGPSEPEGLHVSVDNRLVHGVPLCPGTLELGYQLVVHGTPRT